MTEKLYRAGDPEPPASVTVLEETVDCYFKYLVRQGDKWVWNSSPVEDHDDPGFTWEERGGRTPLRVHTETPTADSAETPPRVQILTEAASLITGDRNKTYGSPTENFANTAALWNVQIGHKLSSPLTAADVAQLMVHLKMARMIAQPKRDNYVDAAGYLACGWECEEASS